MQRQNQSGRGRAQRIYPALPEKLTLPTGKLKFHKQELKRTSILDKVTRTYMYNLLAQEHTTGRAIVYAETTKEYAKLREIYSLDEELTTMTSQYSKMAKEIVSYAEGKLVAAMQTSRADTLDTSQLLVATY